jgi:hypothetical protein
MAEVFPDQGLASSASVIGSRRQPNLVILKHLNLKEELNKLTRLGLAT